MWKETSNFLRASSQGPLQHKKGVIKKEGSNKQEHTQTETRPAMGDGEKNQTWSFTLIDNSM